MKRKTEKPVVILGGGGHAKVVADALLLAKVKILGFVDPVQSKDLILGSKRIVYRGNDDDLLRKYRPADIELVNGVGSTGDMMPRQIVFEKFSEKSYRFASVIHPSAVLSPSAVFDEGVQIMAGAVIQPAVRIGKNSIINTRASVDHDCVIGAHVHVAPGVTLGGDVHVGDRTHIGTAIRVRQGIRIGTHCFIKMNVVCVTEDQKDDTILAGMVGDKPERAD